MAIRRSAIGALVVGFTIAGLSAGPVWAATPVVTIGIDHPIVYLRTSTSVSVYGTVTPPAPHHVVYLQSLSGNSWHSIASTKLTSTSHYAFAVSPAQIATYTLRTYDPPTANGVGGNVSRSITLQTLRPAVTLTIDHDVLPYYRNPTLSGTVSPTSHNHVVYLQSLGHGGVWISIIGRHVDANSAFSISISPDVGRYSFRIYDPPTADGYHAAVSPVVQFTHVVPGAPSVSVTSPVDGATFAMSSVPNAIFSCSAGANGTLMTGLDGCSASIDGTVAVASGTALAGALGAHTVTVIARQIDGQHTSITSHYTVVSG